VPSPPATTEPTLVAAIHAPTDAAARSTASEPKAPAQPVWTLSRGQLVGILFAIAMITISVSTVVAIIVGRSVGASVNPPIGR
jgi:hypothetical protein